MYDQSYLSISKIYYIKRISDGKFFGRDYGGFCSIYNSYEEQFFHNTKQTVAHHYSIEQALDYAVMYKTVAKLDLFDLSIEEYEWDFRIGFKYIDSFEFYWFADTIKDIIKTQSLPEEE